MLAELLLLAALSAPPDLTVVGIVAALRPERSATILRSGGRTRVVRIGETAFGGKVVAIEAKSVVIEYGTERTSLRLAAAPSGGVLPRPPVAPALPSTAPPEDPTTPARSMDRQAVERRLGDEIPRILSETTLVPVTEAGQTAGFMLTRIPEGSLLTDAGLRAGDVLTRINDVPIDSLATLVGLWPRLQNESVLHAVVLRSGRPVSLTVTLR